MTNVAESATIIIQLRPGGGLPSWPGGSMGWSHARSFTSSASTATRFDAVCKAGDSTRCTAGVSTP
jgi:hypothetical protein